MNILVITAHHDDLELGCGGAVARFVDQGHVVTSLVMTHSGYKEPNGTLARSEETDRQEAQRAADVLGYELISLDEDTFDIAENDANVCQILSIIQRAAIDTLLTHWHGDTHPPHRKVHRMALHASRHIPRVLGFAVNWYLGEASFDPRFFISVSEAQWRRKIDALRCYAGEFQRTGERWVSYLDHRSLELGIQAGVARAEAFTVYRYLWDL